MTIEERVGALETQVDERLRDLDAKVNQLSQRLDTDQDLPWWEKIYGVFRDDPEFEEVTRLGREYRESTRPTDEESGS